MAKFKYVGDDVVWIDLAGRLVKAEPGDVVEFPADWPGYVQTGEQGETPLFAPITTKAATSAKED